MEQSDKKSIPLCNDSDQAKHLSQLTLLAKLLFHAAKVEDIIVDEAAFLLMLTHQDEEASMKIVCGIETQVALD